MNEYLKFIDDQIESTLIKSLLEICPDYKTRLNNQLTDNNKSENGIYLFMNRFATNLSDEMIIDLESDFVINSFKFINSIGETNNLEIINIIHVGILEILYSTEGLNRDIVYDRLSNKLQPYFMNWAKYYV